MRITKVYTRTGDKGTTSLVGGPRVAKDDARIEAYGTVDELNSILGIARAANARSDGPADRIAKIEEQLGVISNELFNVGADLATRPEDRWEGMIRVGQSSIDRLEAWMDEMSATLPPLKEFILPGGGPVGAALHQARTVCRRAERRTVTLWRHDESTHDVLRYLNRLSDHLFVLARWAAAGLGEREITWKKI